MTSVLDNYYVKPFLLEMSLRKIFNGCNSLPPVSDSRFYRRLTVIYPLTAP